MMKTPLYSEMSDKSQWEIREVYTCLQTAWESVSRAHFFSKEYAERWPLLRGELEHAMRLISVNKGTVECEWRYGKEWK